MQWQKPLAYLTGSVDQELLLRNAYLVTDNRMLRQQIPGRVRLTEAERKTFAASQRLCAAVGALRQGGVPLTAHPVW
jgi:hypothetical protein